MLRVFNEMLEIMDGAFRQFVAALPPPPDFSGKRLYRYASGTPPTIPSTGFGPYTNYIEIIRYK